MRWTPLLVAVSLASCVSPTESPRPEKPDATEANRPFRLAGIAGVRSLEDTEIWDPVSDEFTAGFEFSKVGSNGFGLEFGLLGSTGFESEVAGGIGVTAAVLEAFAGIRKEFNWGRWRRPSVSVEP